MKHTFDYMPQRGRPPKNLQRKRLSPPTNTKETPIKRRIRREQEHALRLQQKETFIMKLFDRSLDLSKYTEKSSIYPICREWMRNRPLVKNEEDCDVRLKRQDDGLEILDSVQRGDLKEVNVLPLPKKTEMSPIPETASTVVNNKSTILVAKDSDKTESDEDITSMRDEIMEKHKLRWKRVKTKWIQHKKLYEQRYDINFQIIDALFTPH